MSHGLGARALDPKLVTYRPETDFIRVRDFLVQTYARFDAPVNWGIERWNYARYFVAPMLGSYGTEEGSTRGSLEAIQLWESLVGIWEANGEVVGVATIEHPAVWHRGYGEIFVQRHPDHVSLIEEMLDYGEQRFAHPKTKETFLFVYEDDDHLLEAVKRRGYVRNEGRSSNHLEYVIGELPGPSLPDGFSILSMAQEQDIEKRREVFGRSFNHEDPKEWPSAFAYRELMRAPDYDPDYDLVVVAPDGTYAACCIAWYDHVNRVGHLEPLGTHPAYRQRGLARALLLEALHRLKRLGAERMPMTGGFDPFYESFGFRKLRRCQAWEKRPRGA
jgi:predicted N-acetyltransferase YhbS